ncbi:glycosyltransferase [Nisaea sp.]|uniref:glycosyltransferase n=1 Tax=Nisaea sp. TaxID=2024842 RepID=UPI003B526601
MRILFGWEFGAGLGHINRIKPIARAFRERGAEIFLALQENERADAFWNPATARLPKGYHLLPIPNWRMPTDPKARQVPTHSFADVLTLIGYGNEAGFATRLEAWCGLLAAVQPDLVIGDFSPTLNIAARRRVPSLTIGNGYTMPPGGREMPPIRPWQSKLETFSKEHETRLLEIINKVLRLRGEEQLVFLSDAFHGDRSFPLTLPIVDPYAESRSEGTLPPFNMPTGIRPLPLEQRAEDGVFFYMPRSHPSLRTVIDALSRSKLNVRAYISGLGPQQAAQQSTATFRVSPDPLPFNEIMPKARLLVHHGGLSTAVAGAMAGTPQAIVPWNLEHLVTARRIESLGAIQVVNNPEKEFPGKALSQLLVRMARDDQLAAKAIGAAGTIDPGDTETALGTIIEAGLALAKSPGG